jgi:DnaJ-class molecular chaperone
VAGENNDSEGRAESSHEPRECMACRGTGRVISNLGGAPSTVTCPWCEGGGVRVPGIDAQARWLGEDGEREAQGESPGSPE